MFSIRLMRFGSKKKPFYRIVAIDLKSPRNGMLKEVLGYYDPTKNDFKNKIFLKSFNRFIFLIQNGAKVSSTIFFCLKNVIIIFFLLIKILMYCIDLKDEFF